MSASHLVVAVLAAFNDVRLAARRASSAAAAADGATVALGVVIEVVSSVVAPAQLAAA